MVVCVTGLNVLFCQAGGAYFGCRRSQARVFRAVLDCTHLDIVHMSSRDESHSVTIHVHRMKSSADSSVFMDNELNASATVWSH